MLYIVKFSVVQAKHTENYNSNTYLMFIVRQELFVEIYAFVILLIVQLPVRKMLLSYFAAKESDTQEIFYFFMFTFIKLIYLF